MSWVSLLGPSLTLASKSSAALRITCMVLVVLAVLVAPVVLVVLVAVALSDSALPRLTEVASSVDTLCSVGGALASSAILGPVPAAGVLALLSEPPPPPPPPQATKVSVLAVSSASPRRWAHRGTAASGSVVWFKYGIKVLLKKIWNRIVGAGSLYEQPKMCHSQCHMVYLVRCLYRARWVQISTASAGIAAPATRRGLSEEAIGKQCVWSAVEPTCFHRIHQTLLCDDRVTQHIGAENLGYL